jgi:DNA-binding protein H-NS
VSAFEEVVNHKGRLKKELRNFEIRALERIQKNIAAVIDDLREEKEKEEAARMERSQSIEAFKQQMTALGISPEELLEGSAQPVAAKRKAKVPAKYAIEYEGNTVTWTGRGKTPKAFLGLTKEDLDKKYLIK